MPIFTSSPALQSRTFDLPALQLQAQELKNAQGRGKMQDFQLQQAPVAAQREADIHEMKLSDGQRAKAQETAGQVGNMLAPFVDPNIPDLKKAQMWPAVRQRAIDLGYSEEKIPVQFDPQWISQMQAQVGMYQNKYERQGVLSPDQKAEKIEIARAKLKPETRTKEARNAENMGYPPGSEAFKKSIREQTAASSDRTAMQKNVAAVMRIKGMTEEEALDWVELGQGKSRGAFNEAAVLRGYSIFMNAEKAIREAEKLTEALYGPEEKEADEQGEAIAVPRKKDGSIDTSALVANKIYENKNGIKAMWDGKRFVSAD